MSTSKTGHPLGHPQCGLAITGNWLSARAISYDVSYSVSYFGNCSDAKMLRGSLLDVDAAEEEQIEELRQAARKELEDWYKHRDEQLEKTRGTNRSGVVPSLFTAGTRFPYLCTYVHTICSLRCLSHSLMHQLSLFLLDNSLTVHDT